MLVTFSCKSYENITFFGDVAICLLKMMGHSGVVPGAILAEDVPDSLVKLQHALDIDRQILLDNPVQVYDNEEYVSLLKRSVPIVALLNAAINAKNDIMWDYS